MSSLSSTVPLALITPAELVQARGNYREHVIRERNALIVELNSLMKKEAQTAAPYIIVPWTKFNSIVPELSLYEWSCDIDKNEIKIMFPVY